MVLAKNEYEMQHTITYYECDPHGKLTPGMMINLAVLVSGAQAFSLGVGTDVGKQNGGGWVITSYDIQVTKFPTVDTTVILGTRASSYNKFFAFREFWIREEDGTQLAHISGIFVFMDLESRKMVRIPAAMIDPYHSESVKRIPRLTRPQAIEAGQSVASKKYQVRYFDIDSNLHVNNSHYFDWMLDVLGADFLKQHTLVKMNIKYEREVRYGDVVTSETVPMSESQDGQLMTNHQIKVGDLINAQANCWWNESA